MENLIWNSHSFFLASVLQSNYIWICIIFFSLQYLWPWTTLNFYCSDLVSNIVCFVSLGDLEMDARLIPAPSMSWLHQWRMNQSNLVFTRAGGHAYQIYTKYSLSQLYLRTDLFSMYFEGYLKLENWINIQTSLQSAWNSTNFSGKLCRTNIFAQQFNNWSYFQRLVLQLIYIYEQLTISVYCLYDFNCATYDFCQ